MALNPSLLKMVSQAKNKYQSAGGKTIKPKEGRNTYRIIAPTEAQAAWVGASGQWWADLGVHWIKSDPNGKPIAVVGDCDIVYQRPSILNSAIEMAINSAMDEESRKLYEDWKARKSVLLNVIDRSTPGDDPEVLELTPTTFGKILELYMMYIEAGQDITDPVHGIDIVISRTGKGLNTDYAVAVAPVMPNSPHKAVPADTLTRSVNLHEFIEKNYFRGEEQKALNAISQISGVTQLQIIGGTAAASPIAGARTPTPALASSSVEVEGASVTAAPAVDPVQADLEARKKALLKKQQEELAALEATPAPTPAPAAPSLDKEEADAILSELDNLV